MEGLGFEKVFTLFILVLIGALLSLLVFVIELIKGNLFAAMGERNSEQPQKQKQLVEHLRQDLKKLEGILILEELENMLLKLKAQMKLEKAPQIA